MQDKQSERRDHSDGRVCDRRGTEADIRSKDASRLGGEAIAEGVVGEEESGKELGEDAWVLFDRAHEAAQQRRRVDQR